MSVLLRTALWRSLHTLIRPVVLRIEMQGTVRKKESRIFRFGIKSSNDIAITKEPWEVKPLSHGLMLRGETPLEDDLVTGPTDWNSATLGLSYVAHPLSQQWAASGSLFDGVYSFLISFFSL